MDRADTPSGHDARVADLIEQRREMPGGLLPLLHARVSPERLAHLVGELEAER